MNCLNCNQYNPKNKTCDFIKDRQVRIKNPKNDCCIGAIIFETEEGTSYCVVNSKAAEKFAKCNEYARKIAEIEPELKLDINDPQTTGGTHGIIGLTSLKTYFCWNRDVIKLLAQLMDLSDGFTCMHNAIEDKNHDVTVGDGVRMVFYVNNVMKEIAKD